MDDLVIVACRRRSATPTPTLYMVRDTWIDLRDAATRMPAHEAAARILLWSENNMWSFAFWTEPP